MSESDVAVIADTDAVALSVSLDLVAPGRTPNWMTPAADFVARCLGDGVQIVQLERPEMVAADSRIGRRPSSLFFQAVHACFSEHLPLALSPDVLWSLVVGECAHAVALNPDYYRDLFGGITEGTDKKIYGDNSTYGLKGLANNGGRPVVDGDPAKHEIHIQVGSDPNWAEVLPQFEVALRQMTPAGLVGDVLVDFSTTTVESRTGTLVQFMATASPFFEYHTHTRCGIPEIRLLGTAEDYSRLEDAVRRISRHFNTHLGAYFEALIPVVAKLARQADGEPLDQAFWSSIYKFHSGSGTDKFGGWLSTFVNYVSGNANNRWGPPNAIVPKADHCYDWESLGDYGGLCHGSVPSGVSVAPFTWHFLGEKRKMLFFGGIIGIDNVDGYVTPRLSWGVGQKD